MSGERRRDDPFLVRLPICCAQYYDLPFCSPKHTHSQGENLGETLAGDRRCVSLCCCRYPSFCYDRHRRSVLPCRRNSLYDIRFRGIANFSALRVTCDDPNRDRVVVAQWTCSGRRCATSA